MPVKLNALVRLAGVGTVSGRVRALAVLALVALVVLVASAGLAVRDAREGAQALGEHVDPMAADIGDMYLALVDMDAQATRALLTGGEAGWLCTPEAEGDHCQRSGARYSYDIRSEDAQRAALSAARLAQDDDARLAQDDDARLQTVQSLLNDLQTYNQHVQAAMTAGTGQEAVRQYRSATALMAGNLLPKAANLGLSAAADADAAYREGRSAALTGALQAAGAGLALLAAVLGLQVYLARRFRRLVSLPLAAALAGTLVLTVTAASRLATEADHLRTAKAAGLDPALRLIRVRALGKSMNTDRTRQILDPDRAHRYDRRYFDKSQRVLHLGSAPNMGAYYGELGQKTSAWDEEPVPFGGYFGTRAREGLTRAREGGMGALLSAYLAYQKQDRNVRVLAQENHLDAAADAQLDPQYRYLPHPAFRAYDQELDARISHHEFRRIHAAAQGEQALDPLIWLLPVAALAIGALIVAGVWPRLAEYR